MGKVNEYLITFTDECPSGCRPATKEELKNLSVQNTIGNTKQKGPLWLGIVHNDGIFYRGIVEMFPRLKKIPGDKKIPEKFGYVWIEK